ncbi:GNAT family N-acetyltransferase [Microlunatus ginsengisoli]|uniref:GNAT family N-acetyltransferase n=1 Tax=Microlunatus ginsengisoli TaxID=363863 RepID=A0ABP7A5R5_9ACTN
MVIIVGLPGPVTRAYRRLVPVTLRRLVPADAALLAELYRANRDFLAPWEPLRSEDFYTEAYQRIWLADALDRQAAGSTLPWMIMDDGEPVGRITISDVVRGAFDSAHLGYWVAGAANGRGIASAAVAEAIRIAFVELGLHRVQAGTLIHNTGSQKVLARNGFERIGLARSYLRIAGSWQDHLLFQRISDGSLGELTGSN